MDDRFSIVDGMVVKNSSLSSVTALSNSEVPVIAVLVSTNVMSFETTTFRCPSICSKTR